MPAEVFSSPMAISLQSDTDWRLVFFNDKQKIFVDITTTQGKKLFDGIFNGKTVYLDDYHLSLIKAHNRLFYDKSESAKKEGFDFAIKAFELEPSQSPMTMILYAARFDALCPQVDEFCVNCLDDFKKHKKSYAMQDGYRNRISVAWMANGYLGSLAAGQKNTDMVSFFTARRREYSEELKQLFKTKTW